MYSLTVDSKTYLHSVQLRVILKHIVTWSRGVKYDQKALKIIIYPEIYITMDSQNTGSKVVMNNWYDLWKLI